MECNQLTWYVMLPNRTIMPHLLAAIGHYARHQSDTGLTYDVAVAVDISAGEIVHCLDQGARFDTSLTPRQLHAAVCIAAAKMRQRTAADRWDAALAYVLLGVADDAAHRLAAHIARDRAARAIQRRWRRCISDPSHDACRARLLREFYRERLCVQDLW